MAMNRYVRGLAAIVLCMVTACGDCLDIGIFPLTITAVDARTSESVLVGSTVLVDGPKGRDSMTVKGGTSIGMACCSGGRFRVIVRRHGYYDAVVQDIDVETGRCGQPITRAVEVRLVAIPPASKAAPGVAAP